MEITHKTLVQLDTTLKALCTRVDRKYIKFHYALGRNLGSIKSVVDLVSAAQVPSQAYILLQEERRRCLIKHAKKDDKNRPIKKQTPLGTKGLFREEYEIEDMAALDVDMTEILEQDMFVNAEKNERDRILHLASLMDEKVVLPSYRIKMSQCPVDAFNGIEIQLLLECDILEWDIPEQESVQEAVNT